MHKKTSVIMASTITAILAASVSAFVLPNHAFAYLTGNQGQTNIVIAGNGGSGGAGGAGGEGGTGLGLGSVGTGQGQAGGGNLVVARGGDADGGRGGNADGGDACFSHCKAG